MSSVPKAVHTPSPGPSSPNARRARRSFAEIEELMREIEEFAKKVKATAVRRSAGGKA